MEELDRLRFKCEASSAIFTEKATAFCDHNPIAVKADILG